MPPRLQKRRVHARTGSTPFGPVRLIRPVQNASTTFSGEPQPGGKAKSNENGTKDVRAQVRARESIYRENTRKISITQETLHLADDCHLTVKVWGWLPCGTMKVRKAPYRLTACTKHYCRDFLATTREKAWRGEDDFARPVPGIPHQHPSLSTRYSFSQSKKLVVLEERDTKP